MKAFFILSCTMIFTISAVQAGSIVDLDFSGLSTLSESNKKLSKMVEMQKQLSGIGNIFGHSKSETKENNISDKKEDNDTALEPYPNQGTKHLEKKYLLFDGWKILKIEEDQYSLQKNELNFSLEEGNVKPTLKEIKEFKNLSIIIFHQSTNGTSFMVDTYNAVIFDLDKEKFIGEFHYEDIPITKHTPDMLSRYPQWIYKKNYLFIIDEDEDIYRKIYVK